MKQIAKADPYAVPFLCACLLVPVVGVVLFLIKDASLVVTLGFLIFSMTVVILAFLAWFLRKDRDRRDVIQHDVSFRAYQT